MGFDAYLSHDNFFELDPVFSRDGAEPTKFTGESSEIVAREACQFIRGCKTSNLPFLTLVWFGSPHSPYSASEEDSARYSHIENLATRNRFAEITAMDRAIGTLRKTLRELQIADNTLIWYRSDNGMGHDPKDSFNGPWREKKGSIFEGGVRVPGIIEWPASLRTIILVSSGALADRVDSESCLPMRSHSGTRLRLVSHRPSRHMR